MFPQSDEQMAVRVGKAVEQQHAAIVANQYEPLPRFFIACGTPTRRTE